MCGDTNLDHLTSSMTFSKLFNINDSIWIIELLWRLNETHKVPWMVFDK